MPLTKKVAKNAILFLQAAAPQYQVPSLWLHFQQSSVPKSTEDRHQ